MNLLENFSMLLKEQDEDLFEIFKQLIDNAKIEAKEKNLNPISTFIHVNEKIEYGYIQLALAKGIIVREKDYSECHNQLIISEKLLEKIYTYIEPITKNARKEIKLKVNYILMSSSLEELKEEFNNLMKLLSNDTIQKNSYVYEEIELEPKQKKKTKEFKNPFINWKLDL